MIKYNHDRPITSFLLEIKKLRLAGFEPIAVTQMYFEDTFVFEDKEEAKLAFEVLEVDTNSVVGWFYGREDFLKAVEDYEKDDGYKVRIYWL